MKIHKEGRSFLLMLLLALIVINGLIYLIFNATILTTVTIIVSLGFFSFFTYFFRISERTHIADDNYIVAPADGTIVVIEPTEENGLLHEKRIQVSIFMSPFNMHANWYPIAGKILHSSHQKGRYMAAYLPKSSTENERSTVLIEAPNKQTVLVRQVAGALARRIVTYAKEGQECHRNEQMGFIKFGSRVDLYLPLDAEILVDIDDETVGNETIIAKLKHN